MKKKSDVFNGRETVRDYTTKTTLKKSKGTARKSTIQKAVNEGHNVQVWRPKKKAKKTKKSTKSIRPKYGPVALQDTRTPSPELN